MEIIAENKDPYLWDREQVDHGQIRCDSYPDIKCIKQTVVLSLFDLG